MRRRHGPVPLRQAADAELESLLTAAYADAGDAAAVVGAAENEVDLDRLMHEMPEVTDLLDAQDDAPVIRMINALFTQAARDGASDIHIEPFETHSVVRYRVDGGLRDVVSPRKALHSALISRIKIMAHRTSPRNACRRTAASRCAWAAGPSTFACPRCRPGMVSAPCCDCWTRKPGASSSNAWAWRPACWRNWTAWCTSRTASCS